jgi:hypothetical protein
LRGNVKVINKNEISPGIMEDSIIWDKFYSRKSSEQLYGMKPNLIQISKIAPIDDSDYWTGFLSDLLFF